MENKKLTLLEGSNIYLRPLVAEDATADYVQWMNDYEIVKYTESRFSLHTKETLMEFINGCNDNKNFTFAIIHREKKKHIGNIKLSILSQQHRVGSIGLIIGKPEFYGQGIATEAIKLVSDFGFIQLSLHRITCGAYAENVGSIRAFEKADFRVYGRETKSHLFEGQYIDCVLMEKLHPLEK